MWGMFDPNYPNPRNSFESLNREDERVRRKNAQPALVSVNLHMILNKYAGEIKNRLGCNFDQVTLHIDPANPNGITATLKYNLDKKLPEFIQLPLGFVTINIPIF